jgi:hypothetical protein
VKVDSWSSSVDERGVLGLLAAFFAFSPSKPCPIYQSGKLEWPVLAWNLPETSLCGGGRMNAVMPEGCGSLNEGN